jgi:hypothetical protein
MRVTSETIQGVRKFLKLLKRQQTNFIAGIAVQRDLNHAALGFPRKISALKLIHIS